MAAHRYWRIINYRNAGAGNQYTGLTELELRTAIGGADQTGSGTALSAGSIQAGTAANAFDNNNTSIIQWGGWGQGVWVGYDFGAGNEKDIVEIAILPNKDQANRTFGDFRVQWSDDGVSWTDDWWIIQRSWTIGVWQYFARPSGVASGPAQCWRIRGTTVPDTTMSCGECEMRESVGGADVTGSGTASADSVYSGSPASNAFDNNNSTLWSGAGTFAQNAWLKYDFGAGNAKNIVEISWRARGDCCNGQNPTAGVVEASPDGVNWLPRWTFSVGSWTIGQTKVFSDSGAAPAARRRQAVVC